MPFPIVPPIDFNLQAHADKWFTWDEIEECFWPGRGGRSESVNLDLAQIKDFGGVYLLAWSASVPLSIDPACGEVQYIGQTNFFKGRMGQFATSAGFWGKRDNGHSAGWRWPEGKKHHLLVAFFPIGNELQSHLAEGLRHWVEALAIESHRNAQKELPIVNRSNSVVTFPIALPGV